MALAIAGSVVFARHYWHNCHPKEVSHQNDMVFTYHMSEGQTQKRIRQNPRPLTQRKPRSTTIAKKETQNTKIHQASLATKTPLKQKNIARIHNPQVAEYMIRPGDRLDKISMTFYGTHHKYKRILAANPGLNSDKLIPGTRIVIPGIETELPQEKTKVIEHHESKVRPYIIAANDILSKIAEREVGTIKSLPKIKELNPGLDPHKIKPGQTIYLPVNYRPGI
ncbi:MAG: LysM peptidoglycan-binding domain-containing protein [Planctomycetes bacterium]|nr:LysM peptidoglycan-binding domain-containing protein [Planctomycetota bacterium]